MKISADTTLRSTFPEVLSTFQLQIVNDSILVFSERQCNAGDFLFKAYSTVSFDFLGSFIRNGRGPGEMIYPHIACCNAGEKYLNLNDNQSGKAHLLDVPATLESGKTTVTKNFDLPANAIDWLYLPDSGQFMLLLENNEILLRTCDTDGNEIRTFHPYKDIDGERCLTHLSSYFVRNKEGLVAEAMNFFPCINFFDTGSGEMRSIAVSRKYRQWESIINRMIDMDMMQYYIDATACEDYIFAVYKGIPLRDMIHGSTSHTSIHVFDWNGDFLYDLKADENIGSITFDEKSKCLYCTEKSEDKVIRYNLSHLL
ncbi:MAG: TolB-like 6-bladed beta-propeller domain-containing protein [Bacteroidales bacterium]|nr:TolB-like 6-bladed beta-propeller domain-containing protein [Bacteroidales bacterium]